VEAARPGEKCQFIRDRGIRELAISRLRITYFNGYQVDEGGHFHRYDLRFSDESGIFRI
jgi:hypothetical protein